MDYSSCAVCTGLDSPSQSVILISSERHLFKLSAIVQWLEGKHPNLETICTSAEIGSHQLTQDEKNQKVSLTTNFPLLQVHTDSLWRGLAERRGWIRFLFKPRPGGEPHPEHAFYRRLYPSIIR